jgi:peptidoglycan/LPS O-acetylase OafA/YrhL
MSLQTRGLNSWDQEGADYLGRDTFSLSDFYARRVSRIFPALSIVLLTCYLIGWGTLFAEEFLQLGTHIFGGATFISNIILWRESGYFDTSADFKPLLHLWSLGIEEQFYIFYPLLVSYAYRTRLNLFYIILSISSASFLLNIVKIINDSAGAFYSPLTRFWELLIGGILAYLTIIHRDSVFSIIKKFKATDILNSDSSRNWFATTGLIFFLIGFISITRDRNFPGFWALLPTIGTVFLIAAGPNAWFNRVILSSRIFVGIGLISYPLYLWHWPLLSFARIIVGSVPSIKVRFILVFSSFLLAYLTYSKIEFPLRKFKDPRKIRIILIASIVILGLVGLVTKVSGGFQFRAVAQKSKGLNIAFSAGFVTCKDLNLFKEENLNYCLIKPNAKINAAIIGDSHAEDKFYGLEKNDIDRNWMLIGNSSCPPALGIDVEADQKGCQNKVTKIIQWLRENNEIKTVALSFYGNYFLDSSYAADHIKANGPPTVKISSNSITSLSRADIFYDGLNQTVTELIASGKKVILFIDIPELPFFPKDCIRISNPFRCQIQRSEVNERQGKLRELIHKLQILHPTLVVFDPIEIFCTEKSCSYLNGDIIFYRDSHHLNMIGSDFYAKYFLDWLKKN